MGRTYCLMMFLYLSINKLTNSQTVTHGDIQSPKYPRPYLPQQLKQWQIVVPEGSRIQLLLRHLDIRASPGCHQDSLTILEGVQVLGKFCGQENSTDHPGKEPVLSEGNKLTLVFRTSYFDPELHQHAGFFATPKAIDIDECLKSSHGDSSGPLCSQICVNTPGSYRCSCRSGYKLHLDQRTCVFSCRGHVFDKLEGHISSPRYPHPSPPFLSCKYVISVEPRFSVTLNFTDNFHIHSTNPRSGPRCLHHWLQVSIPDREPIKLCGGESPGLIATNSSTVRLDYHTEYEGLSRGWSLNYYTYATDCREPEPLLNGGVTFLSGSQNLYRSVIQYHCNEPFYTPLGGANVTFACEEGRMWRSMLNITPACVPVCGKPTKLISSYQRIIGGREAPGGTIPWKVLLNIGGIRAGGMVIADRWVMTAAHELTRNGKPVSKDIVRIYMGKTDVKSLMESPVYAASVHTHPGYNNTDGLDFNHDIALVKLKDPLTFDSSVMPICLPAGGATYETGLMGLLSGFGLLSIYPPQTPTNLGFVELPVVNQEICHKSISQLNKSRNDVPRLTHNMFCAGFPEGGKDACLGDSGAPFALKDDEWFWAAGLVSWGVECGQPGRYRVFTRVTNYLDWINQTMQDN